jgi:HEAT repeat protein
MLIAAIRAGDAYTCRLAVRTLAEIGPEANEAIPTLSGLLRDQDAGIRSAAAEALRKIRKRKGS